MAQPVSNVISLLRAQWMAQAEKGAQGRIVPNFNNAMLALRSDPDVRDVFAFDRMLHTAVMTHEIGEIVTCDRRVTEFDVCNLLEWMQRQGMPYMRMETVRSALATRAQENEFHPVVDYLMALQWDGVERLSRWLRGCMGAEESAYNEHIGKMFLLSMVARVVQPGCKADHMMVLEGAQGILKSSACRVLGGRWFSDHLPDITSGRDVSQHLRGKWLIEVSEMHAMSRAEATLLKSFVSRSVEQYRPSYGRLEVEEPRQCVFVGTTNMEQYLKDPTGGRRFWPVKTGLSGAIELGMLADWRDQLFAEAVEVFNGGGNWWPDGSLERELIKPEQASRFVGDDIWEDEIERLCKTRSSVTTKEIATLALGLSVKDVRQEHSLRIASILREMGWSPRRTGRRRWWERGEHVSQTPSPTDTSSPENEE